MINKRYQNGISRVAAYPGADIGSDHKSLVAEFCFRCKLFIEKTIIIHEMRNEKYKKM